MKKLVYTFVIFGLLLLGGILLFSVLKGITPSGVKSENAENENYSVVMKDNKLQLPEPQRSGGMSLAEALTLRRSIRSYASAPLTVEELSQLLWSAQGITNERGFRTAPSAGATFPLEIFVVINSVSDLDKGIYHYSPEENALIMLSEQDVSDELTRASLSQSMIKEAGIVLVFGAVFERTQARYGERGERYVYNEVGHASQNVHLQAAALNLGTVVIGAYRDEEVEKLLNLGEEIRVLYMMPVGKTE